MSPEIASFSNAARQQLCNPLSCYISIKGGQQHKSRISILPASCSSASFLCYFWERLATPSLAGTLPKVESWTSKGLWITWLTLSTQVGIIPLEFRAFSWQYLYQDTWHGSTSSNTRLNWVLWKRAEDRAKLHTHQSFTLQPKNQLRTHNKAKFSHPTTLSFSSSMDLTFNLLYLFIEKN